MARSEASLKAEARFRARLEAIGATLLEPHWLGISKPHRVLCANGHECFPRPAWLTPGRKGCAKCDGKEWDIFYVVADAAGNIKFGITSRSPHTRLGEHRRNGFTEVILLHTGLPDGVALAMEKSVLDALAMASIKPIRGREYFPPEALPIVLALASRVMESLPS